MILARGDACQPRSRRTQITAGTQKAIVINGRFLSQTVTGVQRYATEVLHRIDALLVSGRVEPPSHPIEVLVPPGIARLPHFHFLKVRGVGRSSGQMWEQLQLPLYCRGKVLFTPAGGAPLLHADHIFTIHDAGVFATPQAYSERYGIWYRWHHRRAVANKRLRLLTVSQSSKQELVRWLGVAPERIRVTLLGHEHALVARSEPAVLEKFGLSAQRYVLGVGSANTNKNFQGLLHAFEDLRQRASASGGLKLVVAGGANARIFNRVRVQREAVLETGYLPAGELRALYEHAACFVFPSFYEGFGLPPLEAMALGCPVACSRASSLPEVCGEAALYFNPANPREMASAMEALLADPELRRQMSQSGAARAREFQWERTARSTWTALMEAAQGESPYAFKSEPAHQDTR